LVGAIDIDIYILFPIFFICISILSAFGETYITNLIMTSAVFAVNIYIPFFIFSTLESIVSTFGYLIYLINLIISSATFVCAVDIDIYIPFPVFLIFVGAVSAFGKM
jgi:hypothetical protein